MGRPRKRKKSDEDSESATVSPENWELGYMASPEAHPMYSLPVTMAAGDTILDPWFGMNSSSASHSTDILFDDAAGAHAQDFASLLPSVCLPNITIPGTEITDPPPGTCNCIAILTDVLQIVRPLTTFHFPVSVGHLRNCISSLSPVINCMICPKERGTATQNLTLLNAVLSSLMERVDLFLSSVDEEAERLNRAGGMKELKVADPTDMQLHTGLADCPAGLVVYLNGTQWRELATASIRKLIRGPGVNLDSLLEEFEERQEKWHRDPEMEKMRKGAFSSRDAGGHGHQPGGCIFNIKLIRRCMEELKM